MIKQALGMALFCAILPTPSFAGDLIPPPGPVQPTGRTILSQAITPPPITISLPGSYVLTSNLTGVVGEYGIIITASDVTLDLNGFALVGVPGSLDGITVPNAIVNLSIRNGVIRDWGGGGVFTFNRDKNSLMTDLRVSGNGGVGLQAGEGSSIVNCVARNNSTGIASGGSVIQGCVATGNTGVGINGPNGCVVIACTASFNGSDGIQVRSGTTVTNCVSRANSGHGIHASGGCLIVGNNCVSNGFNGDGAGIRLFGLRNRAEANVVSDNDCGIEVFSTGNIILRNTATGNTINYEIAADNVFGMIVDRTAPASAAVSGNSAPSSAATTDPWANFSY